MDDELNKKLIEIFQDELEVLLRAISNSLDLLKKEEITSDTYKKLAAEIARSARNIKVTASATEVNDVTRVAHPLEIIFSSVEIITPEVIDLTHRAVDEMRAAMQAFVQKKPLKPDFDNFVRQLQQFLPPEKKPKKELPVENKPVQQEKKPIPTPKPEKKVDTNFLNQIVEVFKTELEEKLLVITDGLLELESSMGSDKDLTKLFEEIFRAAHNIKGSARGIGAMDVGEISHHIETLFIAIQKKELKVSAGLINLCLQAVDSMREAMQCFSEKKPLTFDLSDLISKLQQHTEIFPEKK